MPKRPGKGTSKDGGKSAAPVRGRGRTAPGKRGIGVMVTSGAGCVCPVCGVRAPGRKDVPCTKTKCPNCGAMMVPR